MKSVLHLLILFVGSTIACAQTTPLVPQPANITHHGGHLQLADQMSFSRSNIQTWNDHLKIVAGHLEQMSSGKLQISPASTSDSQIQVHFQKELPKESYRLQVTDKNIHLHASSLKGLTRASATLTQLMGSADSGRLPLMEIRDGPSVAYRNLMIDMGRNPHSVELLKETIDMAWFYKLDSIHLHLTDDQRFAFPSSAFPKLWDKKITLKEFQELENYAVLRGVTLIPELEVPGHSSLLRSRYPDTFGQTATELATSDQAFEGIKTILDEMISVFQSSPYIHIGGDEAFGVPEDAQRNLINRLHAYLKTKGRQTLVWEGPGVGQGENKVNTEVIHINWRTINFPADQMIEQGYQVINAAWDPLYLVDHYPRTNFTMTSPQHIYESLKLTQFKHVNPGITTYHRPIEVEPTNQLIGFCMPWWEGRESNYFTQVFPRLIPVADVAWNLEADRDFSSFRDRSRQTELVRQRVFYPVNLEAKGLVVEPDGVFHNSTEVRLSLAESNNESSTEVAIRYTLDGTPPVASSPMYQSPIKVHATTTVRAALFVNGKQTGHGTRKTLTAVNPVSNLALGKPVTSTAREGIPFSVQRITDGGTGNLDFYLGYPCEPEPIELTIDLEGEQEIGRINVIAYTISNSYEKYTVEVSADGKQFEKVASRLEKPENPKSEVEHSFPARKARYVRIRSHGNKGYVFDSFSKIVEVQVFRD